MYRPAAHEHLMIVYFDMLLLDDQSLLDVRHSDRFKLLEKVVRCSKGRAELVPRQIIDFAHPMGASNLRNLFAKSIVDKKEGLVLKPDDPYFCFRNQKRRFAACCTKLKKEYIGNFGDVGDFAVVGARFDPVKARSYRIPNLKWTHFYVGCLDNKEEVKRWASKPEFTVVNVVELSEGLLNTLVSCGNPVPTPVEENTSILLKLAPGVQKGAPLTVVFTNPLVFDLRCFSFDKEGNTGFWSLRFPVVTKIHFDRDFTDTVSFEELQTLAKDGITSPELEDSQENLAWIARLEGADPRGIAVDAASQLTATTMPTPSPRRSTQSTTDSWSPAAATTFGPPARAGSSQPQGAALRAHHRVSDALPFPLITPLTSSAPSLPPPKSSPGANRRKRTSLTSSTASPASKRRRSHEAQCPLTSSPAPFKPTRKPLEEIEPNSQHSTTPNASFMVEVDKSVGCIMAEPTSSTTSFSTAATRRERSETEMPSSQAAETTVITIPDDDENQTGSHFIHSALGGGCSFANTGCQLAKHIILMCPESPKPPRLIELLNAHDLQHAILDPKTWAQRDHQRALSNDWEAGPDKILLIDSLELRSGTKVLLNELEEIRKSLPEGRRDWITIYDWRVLDHLRILEDEQVAKKYYDGFSDPWRRWYCGLV